MDNLLATAISAASVLIAVLALTYSVQQVHLMQRQNLLPIALDFFREARTPEWFVARDWVLKYLAAECLPRFWGVGPPRADRGQGRAQHRHPIVSHAVNASRRASCGGSRRAVGHG